MNTTASETAFTRQQYENIYPDDINNHYWDDARNVILESTIKGIQDSSAPILEIGCGRGAIAFLTSKIKTLTSVELRLLK